jgi:hypothetical protein
MLGNANIRGIANMSENNVVDDLSCSEIQMQNQV